MIYTFYELSWYEYYRSSFPHTRVKAHHLALRKRFIQWCENQDEYRLGWLAASFVVHGCIFVPMTLMIIAAGGNNFVFVALTLGSMIIAVTTNLADLHTKVSLPVLLSTLVLDLLIIASRVFHGLNVHSLFVR